MMKRPIDDIANWQLQQENTSKPFPYIFPQMPPRFQRWCVFAKVVFLIQRGCFAVFCLGSMMLLVPVIIFGKDLKLSVMTDNHPFLALLVMATAVSLLLFFLVEKERKASSALEERVLVSFLVLHTLISISSALGFCPTTIPEYTFSPGPIKRIPRSWAL